MNSKILVTGGAGYIGSHTCKKLSKMGYQTVVFDNLSTGHKSNIRWSEFVEGDVKDRELLCSTFKKFKPDAVIHFAASAYVGESVENPNKYFDNNVVGSLNLISAMLENEISNIVFSSTCATYGTPKVMPISENTVQLPINPYGQSKLIVEQAISEIAKKHNLNFFGLRYFNAAGADEDGDLAESHDPETHLIPLLLKSVFTSFTLEVFGSDFPTKDGSAIRDYIHVEDLADAHVTACTQLINNTLKNEFINLGTGIGVSVLEVIEAAMDLGLKPKFKKSPRREGDPPELVADPSKAKLLLGWQAERSSIHNIIKTATNTL